MRPIREDELFDLAWHVVRFPREQRRAEIERVAALADAADRYRKRIKAAWVPPVYRQPLNGAIGWTARVMLAHYGHPQVSRRLSNPEWAHTLCEVFGWAMERAERQKQAREAATLARARRKARRAARATARGVEALDAAA